MLEMPGVAVSSGAARSSESSEPSYVLLAMGRTTEQAHQSLRFGLGRDTSRHHIDYVVEQLVAAIERARG